MHTARAPSAALSALLFMCGGLPALFAMFASCGCALESGELFDVVSIGSKDHQAAGTLLPYLGEGVRERVSTRVAKARKSEEDQAGMR